MKKRNAVLFGTALLAGMMTACGGDTAETTAAATTAAETAAETEAAAEETEAAAEEIEAAAEIVAPAEDVAMQYVSAEDAAGLLNTEGTTIFDVRKAEDYAAGHIPGAVSVDMDAAKEGDFEAGVANMQPAVEGLNDDLILVCYSGKRYAQAATNVLSALGYDMSKVYTLEGGMEAWNEAQPDNLETAE